MTFRQISQLWDNAYTLNLENCLLYISYTISQFFDFIQCMVFEFIFYCVTMHTLYIIAHFCTGVATANFGKRCENVYKLLEIRKTMFRLISKMKVYLALLFCCLSMVSSITINDIHMFP